MEDILYLIGGIQIVIVLLCFYGFYLFIKLFSNLKNAKERDKYIPWKYLFIALILFALEEVVGALDAFNILREYNFLRHIIPSFLLLVLILAVAKQISVLRYIENE